MLDRTNVISLIKARQGEMPAAQRQIAAAILADPEWALRANVGALARKADVSPPTIVRFCRALGLQGLRDFKLQLASELALGAPPLHRTVEARDDVPTLVQKVVRGSAGFIAELERQLDPAMIEAAIEALTKAGRVDCYGVGNTSIFMANDAQGRFFRIGLTTNAYFDAHMQLVSAATLRKGDVLLAISHVGRMPTLLDAVGVAREKGATVISLTQAGTPLAKLSQIPLVIAVPEDAILRVGTEANLAHIVLIEMLVVGVALRMGKGAIARLRMLKDVLIERGIDSEQHPAMRLGWSKADYDSLASRRKKPR